MSQSVSLTSKMITAGLRDGHQLLKRGRGSEDPDAHLDMTATQAP